MAVDSKNIDDFEQYKNEISKLNQDLDIVVDKIMLCKDMLVESPGLPHDDALAEVIGFLEACKDRMLSLIDAGAQNRLPDTLFSRCLQINDLICKVLDAEKNGSKQVDISQIEVTVNSNVV